MSKKYNFTVTETGENFWFRRIHYFETWCDAIRFQKSNNYVGDIIPTFETNEEIWAMERNSSLDDQVELH